MKGAPVKEGRFKRPKKRDKRGYLRVTFILRGSIRKVQEFSGVLSPPREQHEKVLIVPGDESENCWCVAKLRNANNRRENRPYAHTHTKRTQTAPALCKYGFASAASYAEDRGVHTFYEALGKRRMLANICSLTRPVVSAEN